GGEKYTVTAYTRGFGNRMGGCGQGSGGGMRCPDRASWSMNLGLPIPSRMTLPETLNEYAIGKPRTTAKVLMPAPFSFARKWRALQKSARKPALDLTRFALKSAIHVLRNCGVVLKPWL